MALTYSQYVTQLATLAVVPETDPFFLTILPDAISYAELRIQRDLDLLATVVADTSSYSTTASQGYVNILPSQFISVQTVSITTPASTTFPLVSVSKEYIQNVFNGNTTGTPTYFAMYGSGTDTTGLNNITILLGPIPDATYPLTITGTERFAALSASNTPTYISTYFPDLFLMASMIYVSAYQRNFGKMNDDPQMAVTYESQYQTLLRGSTVEEYRKKFEGPAWSSLSPSPIATPPRS